MFSFVCICIYTSMTADNTRSGCWPRRTWRGGACCRCCPPQAADFQHFFRKSKKSRNNMNGVWCFCEHHDRHHHSSLSSESLSNKLIIIKITTVIIKIPTMLIKITTVIIINIIKIPTMLIKITTMIIIKSTTCPLRASPVCSLNCSIRLFCGAACCWKNALSNLNVVFCLLQTFLFPRYIDLFLPYEDEFFFLAA